MTAALLFFCGLLAWTLTEYLLHVWNHGILKPCPHHQDPVDYSIGPPFAMIACWLLGVWCLVPLWFAAGFTVGYVAYATLHWAIHHKQSWFLSGPEWLWRLYFNHAIHHYQDDTKNYGVTTSLWDHVFGTYRGKQ